MQEGKIPFINLQFIVYTRPSCNTHFHVDDINEEEMYLGDIIVGDVRKYRTDMIKNITLQRRSNMQIHLIGDK